VTIPQPPPSPRASAWLVERLPFAISAGAVLILGSAAAWLIADYQRAGEVVARDTPRTLAAAVPTPIASGKTVAERVAQAKQRSEHAKGAYMTNIVATDRGRAARGLREDIVALLDRTELNAVVIDIKEVTGGAQLSPALGELVRALRERGVWVIARQVVFKDDSQEAAHPDWYLQKKAGGIWRDNRRGSWLDPASSDVWTYQRDIAKQAIDLGFDEIQFDYIRFPSDGKIADIIYPVYDEARPRHAVLAEFFQYLNRELRGYKPEIILSADLFGYVALQQGADLGIGQRLADIGANFDYISLMVYPSHYYSGFQVAADAERGLPALFYPYRAADPADTAVAHPYEVIHRSLLIAGDILAGHASSTAMESTRPSSAKLRPWLQDFSLGVDSARGIRYGPAEIEAQIRAAEDAGASGWLLWSPDNVYSEAALRPDPPAGMPAAAYE